MMGKDLSGNGREKVEPSLESGREASESVSSSAGVTAHDTSQSSPRQYTAMTTTLVLMPQSSAHTAQHQLISDEEAVHGSLAQFHDTSHAQPPPQPSPSTQPRGPFKAYPTQIYQRGQAPTLREPHLGEGMSVMPFRGHMIPDIVIEPIPPRDSFGHSHTPPLVQRQWSLSSPASGKKVRALSDSSIIDLEKTHRQMPEAQQHIPVRGFHSAHEFQTDLDTHPEKRSRGHDMDQSKIQLQGYGHKQPAWSTFYHHTSGEKRATGSPLPMEVDNTNNNKSTSESGKVASKPEMVREMEHSGYAHLQQTSVQVSQGVSVSSPPTSSASSASLSSSLAFHTPEKSPKMYWLRRHSDSHMPGTQSEEQMLTVSRGEASRSKSMGDADRMEKLPLGGDTQETETKETSERLDAIAHLRTSEKMSSTTPTTSIPKSPTGHTIFSERIKLKKYLQKRYQSSLDEESGLKEVNINRPKESERHSVEDVSSPLCTGASPEGMALDTPAQPTAMAPPSKKPPQLSLQETIPLKVEPISPPSESDTEAETPVFFSPSFISPRVFSESPRWHHGVFQFPATRSHQVSLHGTESRSHSGVESSSSTFVSLRSSPLETKDVTMEGPATSSEQHDEWVAGDKSIKDEESKSKAEVCQVTQEKLRSLSSVEGTHYTKGIPGTAHFSPLIYRMASIKSRAHPAMGRSRSEGHMPSRPLSPILQAQRASSPAMGSPTIPVSTYLSQQEQLRISGYASGDAEVGKSQVSPQSAFPSMVGQHPVMPHSQLSPSQFTSHSVHPPFSSYMVSSPTFSARPMFQWSPRSRSQEMTTSSSKASPEVDTVGQLPSHFRSLPAPSSSSSAAGSSGSTSRRMDPSKMICCPFGDKIREQRLSQDPSSVFRCPVCSQLFPSYYYLANHMVNHLPSEVVSKGPGDSNKIHLCKVCNRAFSRSDMLTRHMRLHTGLKPYECHTCGQVFSRSDHLHTHQRTHTGEKPYKCPQCPYAAPRRDMITRHMRIHMKHFTRRGRRTSSTSSDITPQSSTETAEVKRRNQSLSSIDSLESDQSSFRQSSTASTDPEHPDILHEEEKDKGRNWSLTSAESFESTSDIIPSTSSSRHWSVASGESTESYMVPSPGYLQTEPEEVVSPSVPLGSTGTISTDVQMSFQKCAVTSDKDNSSSSSDRDKSSPASVTMEGCTQIK